MWDALRLDVRYSFRSVRRAPTFSLIVIVTLGVAIGATAAIGSLLNAIVLRRLSVPSPERLVALSAREPGTNVDGYFYADTVNAYSAIQRSFAQLSMYAGGGLARVETRSGVFENAVTEYVSPSYFDIVGAQAAAGRFFNDSDDAVVVITEACRRRIFGNAVGVGEAIKFDAVPATVIGIAAEGFEGLLFDGTVDIVVPFARLRSAAGDRETLPLDYYRTLVTELAHMPGADAAALTVYYPTYYAITGSPPPDYHYTRADGVTPLDATVLTDYVSPGFFDLFKLPRLAGRDFSWDDGPGTHAVAVVSASLARALSPAGDVIGQHIGVAGPERRDVEVIGVVADAAYQKLDDPRPLVVFRPILQEPAKSQFPMAYVRASGDVATVREGYTRVVKSLGHRALRGFITSSDWVDHTLVQERFTAGLATFAAALTILLACMGVYGLLAYSVTVRVREIGVRLALGAERRAVVWMIVRDGLAIALPGVLIGAACAWAAARLVRARLYGIGPGDPRTMLIAAAIFLATVLAASLVPALRASRVAPLEALREE